MILWNIKYIAKVVLDVLQPDLRTGHITYRMFHHEDHGFVHIGRTSLNEYMYGLKQPVLRLSVLNILSGDTNMDEFNSDLEDQKFEC